MNKKLLKSLLLAIVATGLIAVPVLAALSYSAPYTVTENASNSYTMIGVGEDSNNLWMANNGFMNSTANDTRIETLGGLEKPHLVTDNRTFTAIPVPANSNTNLYYTTGNSELTSMDVITGNGGYITTADHADLELTDNFTIEQNGWTDITVIGSPFQNAYAKKQTGFAIYNSLSGVIVSAIEGMWLDFERTNTDYVTISDEDEFSFSDSGTDKPFSVSAWVNFEDASDSTIISKMKDATHFEWYLTTSGADLIQFRVMNADGSKYVGRQTPAATSNESTWCHYAATYDGSETSAGVNIYIDGVDSDNADLEALPYTGMIPSDSPVEIGAIKTHTAALMDGKMGEVKIFSSELTPTQVLEEYNGGCSDNVVARWTLAEGTGLPQDSSGNGFHATANTADWDGLYVDADSVTSSNHTILVTADSANLIISIDGAVAGSGYESKALGGASVPNLANDWIFLKGDAMPYATIIEIYKGGSQVLLYQPVSMIIGTTLPDRAGTAQDGVITWGDNPSGVNVGIGSFVSSSQPSIGIGGTEPAQDITPVVEVSDWYVDPDVAGTLLTHPLRPFVIMMSDTTNMSEILAWRFLALAMILLVTAVTMNNVGRHQGITMIVAGVAFGAMVAQTIFPMWTLVLAIGLFIGGLVAERSPTL